MMTPSPNHRSIQLISAVDPKVFLDVDIDGELAAFQLGQAFVEAWREAMSGKIQLANCISSLGPSILVYKVYNGVHMMYELQCPSWSSSASSKCMSATCGMIQLKWKSLEYFMYFGVMISKKQRSREVGLDSDNVSEKARRITGH